ncbi:MAG: hypothetical protein IIA83_00480 [Thaumarchaeota archaeon]|nr:hypothetical protein [Nitrososphaerota archaeon]
MLLANKRGRPTQKRQLVIEKELLLDYERSYSASFTARKNEMNVKTVCKYFKKFSEQFRDLEQKNFFERIGIDRERMILNYDYMISEHYDTVDEIKQQILNLKKANKPFSYSLHQLKSSVLKTIANLCEKKGALKAEPPLDEYIEKIIKEKIQRYDKHD